MTSGLRSFPVILRCRHHVILRRRNHVHLPRRLFIAHQSGMIRNHLMSKMIIIANLVMAADIVNVSQNIIVIVKIASATIRDIMNQNIEVTARKLYTS